MEYSTYQESMCDVVKLSKLFNCDTVNEVRGCFNNLIEKGDRDVLVDMTKVNELDSSGIGALVFLYKRLKMSKRNLGLLGVSGKPGELLDMLRINQTIKQYDSIDEYLSDR